MTRLRCERNTQGSPRYCLPKISQQFSVHLFFKGSISAKWISLPLNSLVLDSWKPGRNLQNKTKGRYTVEKSHLLVQICNPTFFSRDSSRLRLYSLRYDIRSIQGVRCCSSQVFTWPDDALIFKKKLSQTIGAFENRCP